MGELTFPGSHRGCCGKASAGLRLHNPSKFGDPGRRESSLHLPFLTGWLVSDSKVTKNKRFWGRREVFLKGLWGFKMCKTSGVLCTRRSVHICVTFCILNVAAIGTKCWRNPENCHSSSDNSYKLQFLGWMRILIWWSVFFFDDLYFSLMILYFSLKILYFSLKIEKNQKENGEMDVLGWLV